jgi:glyoxylase I family protein
MTAIAQVCIILPGMPGREDVDRLYQLLLAMGARILDAPADYPDYGAGYHAVFFADPDGLKLEFVHWPATG